MRTFIGVDLTQAWRDALAAGCEAVRDASPGWVDQKWVVAENLHLTLKFMGDLDEGAADTLPEDIAAAIEGLAPFELPVREFFHPAPSRKRAAMLWTTFDDPQGVCTALASRIEKVAARYGVLPDTRDFRPHITLCRARRPRSFGAAEQGSSAAVTVLAEHGVAQVMSVPTVTVFKSTLTRVRPYYERLASIGLAD